MSIEIRGTAPVVLVDDDDDFHFMFKRFYKKVHKIENELVSCNSGQACIDYLIARNDAGAAPPALILMDINMPEMTGIECVHIIRSECHFDTVPIISMLSSSSNAKDVERSMSSGANSFFEKPFDLADLSFSCIPA